MEALNESTGRSGRGRQKVRYNLQRIFSLFSHPERCILMDSGARFRQTVIATMMFMMLTNAEKNVIKFRGGRTRDLSITSPTPDCMQFLITFYSSGYNVIFIGLCGAISCPSLNNPVLGKHPVPRPTAPRRRISKTPLRINPG